MQSNRNLPERMKQFFLILICITWTTLSFADAPVFTCPKTVSCPNLYITDCIPSNDSHPWIRGDDVLLSSGEYVFAGATVFDHGIISEGACDYVNINVYGVTRLLKASISVKADKLPNTNWIDERAFSHCVAELGHPEECPFTPINEGNHT